MNDQQPVVTVDNLTKTFRIATEPSSGIKQNLINLLRGKRGYREFTPLKDISFTVNQGEFLVSLDVTDPARAHCLRRSRVSIRLHQGRISKWHTSAVYRAWRRLQPRAKWKRKCIHEWRATRIQPKGNRSNVRRDSRFCRDSRLYG